jgi:hypothetical protein
MRKRYDLVGRILPTVAKPSGDHVRLAACSSTKKDESRCATSLSKMGLTDSGAKGPAFFLTFLVVCSADRERCYCSGDGSNSRRF